MKSTSIILFDGVCNLCNGAVQFVIRHDPDQQFLFAALQSNAGLQLLNQYNIQSATLSSFILIQDGKYYTKSTGALRVARRIKGPWQFLYILIIVPKFIRDVVYEWIAQNRYRWFGKKDSCMIPSPEIMARFLQ